MKTNYESPLVEIENVEIEKGFAMSDVKSSDVFVEDFTDGGNAW